MNSKFKIIGLDCANCAAELERAIQKLDIIKSVSINFMSQRMILEYDETDSAEVLKKVKKIIKREEPDVSIEEI